MNPSSGGAAYMSHAHADRLIAQKRARWDYTGCRLVLLVPAALGGLDDLHVYRFSGTDARPDRAVMPPWPEALARMQ
jgi:hypothetical protein